MENPAAITPTGTMKASNCVVFTGEILIENPYQMLALEKRL